MNIYLNDTFSRTDEPFSVNATYEGPDIEFLDRAGREPHYTNTINLGFDYQVGKHQNLSMGYGNRIRRGREPHDIHTFHTDYGQAFGPKDSWGLHYDFREFNGSGPETEDSLKHSPAFDLSYWFAKHMGLETGVRYTRGQFSGDTPSHNNLDGHLRVIRNFTKHLDGYLRYRHTYFDAEKGKEDDYQVYDPGLGISYAWTEDTFLDVSVGYFYQDVEIGDDNSGISVNGDAVKNWSFKRGSIQATGGAGYGQDFFGAENLGFTVYRYFRLSGYYNFTKRFSGSVSAGYRRDDYINQDPDRVDKNYDLGGGLTYLVRPWLQVSLTERYRLMDSDDEDQNFDENRVTLRVSFLPRPWELN
ncbi:MAG: outer membrane beta-barrel protein [Desulfohalobiaceae bacterium]|nr:outer membrane beta-barrel protein [Desulfohalobiaceae bacterium]